MKKIILTLALAGLVLALVLASARARKHYSPVQPIAFDHWRHVTKTDGPQLECTFCHENVDKSAHATIPNVATCMSCHESVLTDSPEIQKLAAYYSRGEQPPWVRVYAIPKSADVFYTHRPHILAKIDCTTCHGQIAQMRRVSREVDQNMGWCVDCHRRRSVSVDCYICHR